MSDEASPRTVLNYEDFLDDATWDRASRLLIGCRLCREVFYAEETRAAAEYAVFMLANKSGPKAPLDLSAHIQAGIRFNHGVELLATMAKERGESEVAAVYGHLWKGVHIAIEDMAMRHLSAAGGPAARRAPREKPAQHVAVELLYDLWLRWRGDNKYKKNELIEFIRLCLEPAKLNVTTEAVRESLDRHVLPKRKTRMGNENAKAG